LFPFRERIYLMDYQSYTEYPDLMASHDERPVSTARSAMNQSTPKARDHEWLDYYQRFQYFSAEAVRDGCHPRIMEHDQPTQKAIVLVHGLTDSPYFMTAIGDYFFRSLGYEVYLPLLQCHGLKEPRGMEGVGLDEWKANVNFAGDVAASKASHVSIGGLSTGGTLSLYTAVNNHKITGTLYLFSAALDLAGVLEASKVI
jgi:alpha-beta hydrolase superfamily lysophospholipase